MYTVNPKINNQLSIWLIAMFIIISIMIVVGGLTRLTDSGLSITAWELFSGIFPPFNIEKWNFYFDEYKKIPEYKILNFNMTLEEFKVIFYWEWGHRILARIIGLMSIIPLIIIFLRFKKNLFFEKKVSNRHQPNFLLFISLNHLGDFKSLYLQDLLPIQS